MLHFYDRPFVYFPPKPNRLISSLGKLYNRAYYLSGHEHKIISVSCPNSRASADWPRIRETSSFSSPTTRPTAIPRS